MRTVGTHVRGIRTPIIKEGDDLVQIIVSSLDKAVNEDNFELRENDVLAVTESLIARARGNYVHVDQVAEEVREKFPEELGIVFPILSRNRFSLILKGIAQAGRKIYMQLKYPDDEVGNPLLDEDKMHELGLNPWEDILTEADYQENFADFKHPFTGLNYVDLYREMAGDTEIEFIFSNNPTTILDYTKDVIAADIHTREQTKRLLKENGGHRIFGLDDLCAEKRPGVKGYNPEYGLLGSNKSREDVLKLFPRDGDTFVKKLQDAVASQLGVAAEVMIFADGAFKDPVGGIWELADPVVSPGYTSGLEGTPDEIKIKYLADNQFSDLEGEELLQSMRRKIKIKDNDLVGREEAQGTTPRQLTDLLGSLCDLVSGSGDRGTPLIHIQGYFDSLADD